MIAQAAEHKSRTMMTRAGRPVRVPSSMSSKTARRTVSIRKTRPSTFRRITVPMRAKLRDQRKQRGAILKAVKASLEWPRDRAIALEQAGMVQGQAKILWPGQAASTAKNLDLDCPLKGTGKRAKKSFIVCPGGGHTTASSFLSCKRFPSDALERAVSVAFIPYEFESRHGEVLPHLRRSQGARFRSDG